ncbi:NAD(P)H-dependent oxidoreductase [Odoribacter lunatus]|uniref:NAD(P)H-dependent oxidoreductase n=1 Tax=Odoribacter lunatus TaxID=2941335 RepID=UPI00203F7BEC|nr:NAD(P)H-dependent oxidoreductase [Odoribacter lunatus]
MEHTAPWTHLVVFCHPNPKSLSAAYRDELKRLTEKSGHRFVERNLYSIGFNPVLGSGDFEAFGRREMPEDIRTEQEYVKEADLITFIYPIWWTGMPALMKGYIDRVFARGFAYDAGAGGGIKKLLTGKKAIVLNNTGTPYEEYENSGMLQAMRKCSDVGILEFCGLEVVEHHFFGNIPNATEAERVGHIRVLACIYEKLLASPAK